MPTDEWAAGMAELRHAGYTINTVIVTGGGITANETGYYLERC